MHFRHVPDMTTVQYWLFSPQTIQRCRALVCPFDIITWHTFAAESYAFAAIEDLRRTQNPSHPPLFPPTCPQGQRAQKRLTTIVYYGIVDRIAFPSRAFFANPYF